MAGVVGAAPEAVSGTSVCKVVFSVEGDPDFKDAAAVAALPASLVVKLVGVNDSHPLVTATQGFAGWTDLPGPAPNDPPVGKGIGLATLSAWALAGGVMSDDLLAAKQLLMMVIPGQIGGMLEAWTGVGGLCLARSFSERDWFDSLARAAKECMKDDRVKLDKDKLFEVQPRPSSGLGSAAERSWMYEFSGKSLVAKDGSLLPLALMHKAVAPVLRSGERDLPKHRFCRVLSAILRVTSGRSTFMQGALADPQTTTEEVAEMVAETWSSMVASGFPFKLEAQVSSVILELDRASRLTFGTGAEKNLAFQEMFGEFVQSHDLVMKCLGGTSSGSAGLQLGYFQQLVAVVLPEAPWCSMASLNTVEEELKGLAHLVDSWVGYGAVRILKELRDHLKQSKLVTGVGKSVAGEGKDMAFSGISGLEAMRSQAFLDTMAEVKQGLEAKKGFMDMLDILVGSSSKLWYMLGLGKLKGKTTFEAMEGCSQFIKSWGSSG